MSFSKMSSGDSTSLKSTSSQSVSSRTVSAFSGKRTSSMSMKSSTSSLNSLTKNPFVTMYMSICENKKVRPVPYVKMNLKTNTIDVLGDRMKCDEWQTAMEALSTDVSTHHVRIQNKRYVEYLAHDYDTFSKVMSAPKNVSALATLYVVNLISSSITEVLTHSPALVCLELENVLFDEQSLEALMSGVRASQTLQHLSLANCRIGDYFCLVLCRILKEKPNVRSVDLTGCCLTRESAVHGIVDMVKKQQFKRHEECWMHSLRHRTADPDMMVGLRRITVNDNAALGDEGVCDLLEALKDDMYVKAVDMQNCGLTDRGARLALSTLQVNDTLVVVDVRRNADVSPQMLDAIMATLYENNKDNADTKRWKWTKLGRTGPVNNGPLGSMSSTSSTSSSSCTSSVRA